MNPYIIVPFKDGSHPVFDVSNAHCIYWCRWSFDSMDYCPIFTLQVLQQLPNDMLPQYLKGYGLDPSSPNSRRDIASVIGIDARYFDQS